MVKANRSRAHKPDGHATPSPKDVELRTRELSLADERATASSTEGQEVRPLGLHVTEAIATINRLEGLGLSKLDIPLPKCIVLGEQSTGKSSVIEAISGIATPRSTDTCTRCPLFIKMEPSTGSGWRASVSLRKDHSWEGLHHQGIEHRYPGWAEMSESKETQFATTEHPAELEDIIARAQLATLSPLVEPERFLRNHNYSVDGYHRCKFSPNVVCITITQANIPALSFYDLPGIISQVDSAEDESLVKVVCNLVTDYVRNPETLILVTYSLENDIANSAAGGIARRSKATDRCIGVLTKPDRLPNGTRPEKLREILDHKRFTLGLGYFVVKNLGQDEIDQGLTHAEARSSEKDFFETTDPWSTALKDHYSRFGTLKLQRFLSRTLAEHVKVKLPIIHEEINNRLAKVEDDLRQYPEPPVNASKIVCDTILNFSDHVRNELVAEWPCKDWINTWSTLQQKFFDALISMKPTLKTSGERDSGIFFETMASQTGHCAEDSIIIDDDGEDGDGHSYPAPGTPSKKRKVEEAPAPSPMKSSPAVQRTPQRKKPSNNNNNTNVSNMSSHDYSHLRTVFGLDDVCMHLKETSRSKIPGQIEPRVIYAMMLNTLSWERPLNGFFDTLERELHRTMKGLFHSHFGKWEGSPLYRNAWKIVEEMTALNFHQQRTLMAMESLADEKEGPYIFHERIFDSDKAILLETYRQARFGTRFKRYMSERSDRLGKDLTPHEEQKLKKDERFMEVLNREPYKVELGVIAKVVTYYITAARRFHDAVCMRIESKFFKQLRSQLRDELENGLGLNDSNEGPQNAIRLLAEPPERERKRRELVQWRNSLLEGQKILTELQHKTYDDDAAEPSLENGGIGNEFSAFGMPTPIPETEDTSMEDEI